jgi:hypothetical protein
MPRRSGKSSSTQNVTTHPLKQYEIRWTALSSGSRPTKKLGASVPSVAGLADLNNL